MTMRAVSTTTWLSLLPLAALAAEECSLYLAESSTSTVDEPKWGVYAGVDFGENAQLGPPDIAVQLHNLLANSLGEEEDEDAEDDKTLVRKCAEMMEGYTWVADSTAAAFEMRDNGKLNSLISGTALLASYHAKLTNANFNHSSAYFRPPLGENPGDSHAGRGASTHFYNVALKTTTKIPAGHEIFMDYGENFADDTDEEEELTAKDHEKVDKLVDSMIQFLDKYQEDLNDVQKQEIYNFLIHDVMSAAAGPKKGKQVADLLPTNPDELTLVKESGGSLTFASPRVKRDMAWLKTEGMCMDNLVAGASSIEHAGRGAFARRNLIKGTSIAPIPLIHIPDKAVMDMHELDIDGGHRTSSQEVIHQQLLLNYCYGHGESSILLCPAGPLVGLVNHDSKNANAKLVWSKHSGHQPHWFETNPKELLSPDYRYLGLLMELVATRDIKEGEEVFLDYGKEWQEAWDAHVDAWNLKVASGDIPNKWPIRALDLNEEYRTTKSNNKPFKTVVELESDPYPVNVRVGCFLVEDVDDDADGSEEDPKTWGGTMGEDVYTHQLFFCDITNRETAEPYNYTVTAGNAHTRRFKNVPHSAIMFLDKEGTSDQFSLGTFRHAIGIPDDVFPKGPWRDLAKK